MIKRICDLCKNEIDKVCYHVYFRSLSNNNEYSLFSSSEPTMEFCDPCFGRIKDMKPLEKSVKQ